MKSIKNSLNNTSIAQPIKQFLGKFGFYTTKQDYQCHVIALHNDSALYFAIPKVANSSIRGFLSELTGEDLRSSITGKFATPLAVRKSQVRYQFKPYLKFSFVRNPWDRLVSFYFDKVYQNQKVNIFFPEEVVSKGLVSSDMSFAELVHLIEQIPDDQADRHYMSQHVYLTDEYTGEVLVDFIGKFENLEEDFYWVCGKIGCRQPNLPHRNKSSRQTSYREYYTPELVDVVARRYQADLELLKYDF